MASKARPRIERHEAEGLCLRCFDNFPDVNAHGGVDQLKFVDEAYVDRAENVLRQLDDFGRPDAGDRDSLRYETIIELPDKCARLRTIAGNNFRDRAGVESLVARIFALW